MNIFLIILKKTWFVPICGFIAFNLTSSTLVAFVTMIGIFFALTLTIFKNFYPIIKNKKPEMLTIPFVILVIYIGVLSLFI